MVSAEPFTSACKYFTALAWLLITVHYYGIELGSTKVAIAARGDNLPLISLIKVRVRSIIRIDSTGSTTRACAAD